MADHDYAGRCWTVKVHDDYHGIAYADRGNCLWSRQPPKAARMTREEADAFFEQNGGRVVRLLSREEAKARVVAEALRSLATELELAGRRTLITYEARGLNQAAFIARRQADTIWRIPKTAAGTGGRR